jgi:superfamily II DNA/RNA helicase
MLRKNKIGFVELSGKIPVKLRGELIKKFENSSECKIFMSTEAGGAGLNLQMADTLINFELPWNPAKKNQRIGRIDRLGQKSTNLTIYNLITRNSIEQQIAAGLLVKQNLFEGVLDSGSKTDYVDFSSKGRSQFIDQLEAFINPQKEEITDVIEEDVQSSDIYEDSTLSDDIGKHVEDVQQEDDLTEGFELLGADDDSKDTPQDSKWQAEAQQVSEDQGAASQSNESKAAEFEQVMTSGMQFLAGLYKMSTGKDMGMENQQVKINKETGEVTMTFKLPI